MYIGGDGGQALKLLITFVKNVSNSPNEEKYIYIIIYIIIIIIVCI